MIVTRAGWKKDVTKSREIEDGKFIFHFLFVCFRFAVYNEEQTVFLDIHALFQKRSVTKFKQPN